MSKIKRRNLPIAQKSEASLSAYCAEQKEMRMGNLVGASKPAAAQQ